jgi:ParB family chromosome partitioning protein
MKSKRLGRGLEALIPQISPEDEEKREDMLFEVNVTSVHANPFQPRSDFDQKGLNELKQSISENGVIQPITVRRSNGDYELIAGERRLRAVRELGYERIPAYVMEVDSDDQMLELALVENIQREDLNPIELARAYQMLQNEYGLTQENVAQKVGKDRATVANFVRLLKLPKVIQESLQNRELSMGHARALMGLPTQGEQLQLWRKTIKQGWSVRKLEETVRQQAEKDASSPKDDRPEHSPYKKELEDTFRSIFGTQVRIRSSGTKEKIEIFYYSDDDLERIRELFDKLSE